MLLPHLFPTRPPTPPTAPRAVQTLGVPRDAPPAAVRAAFRALALATHPDKTAADPAGIDPSHDPSGTGRDRARPAPVGSRHRPGECGARQ